MIENCPLQITSYIAKYGCIESWKIYLKRAQFMQIENYVGDYLDGVFSYIKTYLQVDLTKTSVSQIAKARMKSYVTTVSLY